MQSLSNDMKLTMSDMFYLGGPLNLRGFQMRGVGPQAEMNALGSTVSKFCVVRLLTLPMSKDHLMFLNLQLLLRLHWVDHETVLPD